MIVTREYIHRHKTPRGAWTRVQIEALGLKWSEKTHGWIDRLEGTEISEEQAKKFEEGRTSGKKNLRKEMLYRIKQLALIELREIEKALDVLEDKVDF